MHRKIPGPRVGRTLLALATAAAAASPAIATTLRIAEYNIDCSDQGNNNNITGPNNGVPTILAAMGVHKLGTNAQPIDILALTEMLDTNNNNITSTTLPAVVTALNNIYGAGVYAYVNTPDATSGGTQFNGPSGFVYNTKTVQNLGAVSLLYSGNSSYTNPRAPMRVEFQPIGYGSNADFYMYVSHMKADESQTDKNERADEATVIRNDEATLPANSSVIYTGDFNSSPPEAEFTILTGSGQGQAFDPENFTTSTQYWSESTDKLEYRDDYEMMTSNVLTDTGPIDYVAGSFQVFGNNGTTPANGLTNASSNTALGDLSNRTTVLNDLMQPYGSDHMPIVADYSIGVAPLALTWNNTGAGAPTDGQTWDTTNNNWNNGTGATVYITGAPVTFNDANNSHYTVILNTTVSPGSVTVNNSLGDYTISGTGSIAGAASLTKSGSRMLTLSTANTYSGGTILNAGTLVVANATGSATGTGNVTLNGGILASSGATANISGNVLAGTGSHTIAPGGIGAVGSLTIGGLTSSNLTTLNIDLGTGSGEIINGDLLILGSGGTTVGSGTLMTFGGTPVSGDDYRLIGDTSGGTVVNSITLSNFTLPAAPAGLVFALSNHVDTGYIDLVVTPSGPPTLTWDNAGAVSPDDGQTWDTTNNNWNNGSGATTYADGALVTFNDTNNGHYAVTLNSTVSPGSVTVNNSLGSYSITTTGGGKIADAGAFTKSGAGTLTIGTALSVGSMSITAGTLQLATGVSGGSGPAVTSPIDLTSLSITGSGVLDINNDHLIITYGASDPITTIAGYIKAGYNGGGWNG
ncbi:MAG: autotransporter-associated beta strand repeat-containing protein, partial [Tepidisphaeraceae bacterium]